jgi:DnaJ-class molecular chaperone
MTIPAPAPARAREPKLTVICATCNGAGEVRFNPSRNSDPQADDYAPCPDCDGTGRAV